MAAALTNYQNPYGSFVLQRYPARQLEPLQAWCAADTLLLEECHTRDIAADTTLVVNDEHGALCVALQPAALWTDSALSAHALQYNQKLNERSATPVVWSTEPPGLALQHVAMRIPKQLAYFEYQLSRLARCLPPGAMLVAAGMDKHLSPQVGKILESYIGPTERRRGQRKARIFCATRDERVTDAPADTSGYYCEALQAQLQAFSNVFSRDKLDLGSRFLMAYLTTLPPVTSAIDLACGNGVLGLTAVKQGLTPAVVFCDESAMAVASARLNVSHLYSQQQDNFGFHHGDGLMACAAEPVELILCNPPFHLNQTVDDFAGRHLLQQCAANLQPGGRLCLVANRHLDYLPTLKREFQRVDKAAQNGKFIVWLAHRA